MAKYLKKPVTVDAVQVPMSDQVAEHGAVIGLFYQSGFTGFHVSDDKGYDIDTGHGLAHAKPGAWIVRGIKGEFYPVEADVFAATFEEVK